MPATRITVTFTGTLTARSEPTGAETSVIFGARALYAATAWEAGSRQDRIATDAWVTLPWTAGKLAKIIGLQLREGSAPLKVRITRQVSGQAVIAAAPIVCLTFPDGDAVTLLEIAGDDTLATEFEWMAAGD
jgi:hypothetical protein